MKNLTSNLILTTNYQFWETQSTIYDRVALGGFWKLIFHPDHISIPEEIIPQKGMPSSAFRQPWCNLGQVWLEVLGHQSQHIVKLQSQGIYSMCYKSDHLMKGKHSGLHLLLHQSFCMYSVHHRLKNEAMNFLPCMVAFVGSENKGMSRR